jgi:altronate dehydratase small subunit
MTAIKIHPKDNVTTMLNDVEQGADVRVISSEGETIQSVKVRNSIPQGHKLALEKIAAGADVIKYGEVIGRARESIEEGMHVHVHNVESKRVR